MGRVPAILVFLVGIGLLFAASDFSPGPPDRTLVEIREGPTFYCEYPEHDLGTFWTGGIVGHEFELRNRTGIALRVRYKPACGGICGSQFVILPGESLSLPVQIQTSKLRGHFEKGVMLLVSDLLSPTTCPRCLHPRHSNRCTATPNVRPLPRGMHIIESAAVR